MTEMAQIRMRAKKADHDKMSTALRRYVDYECKHPELFHYTSTRFYFMDAPNNPDEEIWTCIDHSSLGAAREADPETQKHALAVASLLIPGSVPSRERWTEADELSVNMPPAGDTPQSTHRRREI